MDERLTTKELDRLTDWLTAQGLPPEKVLELYQVHRRRERPGEGVNKNP